jgi:DNA repair ATPase RecN
MKKLLTVICLVTTGLLSTTNAHAQADELMQLALNIEKLTQFKQILSDMKKGYQIIEGGYGTIKNISEGNFSLHKTFLDGLMQVSPTVKNYKRVGEVINYQIILVKEYKNAYDRFKSSDTFNPKELSYLTSVYDNLFKQSLRNLDELLGVVTAGKMRMSDDERLKAIDRIHADMQDKVLFLKHFNNNTSVLAVQRMKEKNDVQGIGKIYGINN